MWQGETKHRGNVDARHACCRNLRSAKHLRFALLCISLWSSCIGSKCWDDSFNTIGGYKVYGHPPMVHFVREGLRQMQEHAAAHSLKLQHFMDVMPDYPPILSCQHPAKGENITDPERAKDFINCNLKLHQEGTYLEMFICFLGFRYFRRIFACVHCISARKLTFSNEPDATAAPFQPAWWDQGIPFTSSYRNLVDMKYLGPMAKKISDCYLDQAKLLAKKLDKLTTTLEERHGVKVKETSKVDIKLPSKVASKAVCLI